MSMIGKTLGTFECTSLLGKGGMGEVYKAKDQKLERDVAIKVLPEEFAKDADRVARFQREAKLLASLNHPNIAAIHGLEESDGTHFLVLELIEGDTLADRLKRGAIPVEESLKLALQIAEALEAAHEKGVIHRDLKPANIKVTPDGKVKVLDFGLAKAFAGDSEDMNLSNSPTLSAAATQQGIILGTAAYMSPEQARGKSVDKRTDIWAFGVVLYEMLTGQSAFQGEDVSVTLASVIKGDVNLTLLPPSIHPRVREVITRCLQNEQKKRYPEISEAQYEIEQVLADPSGVFVQPVAAAKPRKKMRLAIPWVAVAVILTAIIASIAVWYLKPIPPPEPKQVTHFEYELPEGQQFGRLNDVVLAVSPDGAQIVYATTSGLYLRSMDELEAKLIRGTEGNPDKPFFSPDSKWIGYWSVSENQLKKIAVSGGGAITLTNTASLGSYSWQADGTIVYGQYEKGIMRVSANAGTPELFIEEEEDAIIHPQILPDGKSLLYSNISSTPSKIILHSLQSGERKELFPGGDPRYINTGHIIYTLGNNILAVPFDIETLKVTGGSVPLVENVVRMGGALQYAISDSGTLVYLPWSGEMFAKLTLVWVDRNGREDPLGVPDNYYWGPRVSPDGTQVAVAYWHEGGGLDTFIYSLTRKTMTRLTFDPAEEDFPLWTLDGKGIIFYSNREGNRGIYAKAADGTGKEELIRQLEDLYAFPGSWSEDGKALLIQEVYGTGSTDLYIGALSMEKDHNWKPLLQGQFSYDQPRISPDGKWLAYTSNESGQNEIFVCSYPDIDRGKWQISPSGGDSALWSPDGSELFYRNSNSVMAVPVKSDQALITETPRILFQGAFVAANHNPGSLELSPWDISPDGKRFLMMKESGSPDAKGPRKINIVLNWFEELKDRVPVD